ncbi:MAG: hypothetical protein IJT73_08100 [Selenomonadaceae bacterium]|nr:hypothetical protein [Selenomonadaceae bacterium]
MKKISKPINTNSPCVDLYYNGKSISRTTENFYRYALDAFLSGSPDAGWATCNFLENKYEANLSGEVRNAKTKKFITPKKHNDCIYFNLTLNGKRTSVSVGKILYEVFGTPYRKGNRPVNVMIRKDGLSYKFESMVQAAKFLQGKIFYSQRQLLRFMNERKKDICGWQVEYLRGK